MLKKVVVFFAILTAMASFSVASASQLVKVLQDNTLWGITEACGQPGSSWTQLYRENPNLPPISIDRQGRNIAWINAGDYLVVPDGWNLGSVNPASVHVVEPDEISVPPVSFGNESAWMGSEWFKTLVVGVLLLLAFVLGAVLVRRSRQPMYGVFPGVPMAFPPMMQNELNITFASVPPAASVVGEVSAPAAPVVASAPTAPAEVVADMPSAEVAPPAKADTHAAGE
jgi:hypothetical protein